LGKEILGSLELNRIYQMDCLEGMKLIPDKSVDMILCDLPYGTTACAWDIIIPFDKLWEQYERIIKNNGAIVLTASQPFTSKLVTSNLNMFKYSWIYKKRCASNFAQAKYAPMKEHEDVLIFAKGKVNYYPIKEERQGSGSNRVKYKFSDKSTQGNSEFVNNISGGGNETQENLRFPSSVQEFNNRAKGDRGLHPTQKPVALFEYLIKTYTNKGQIVLDNCMGSGTTAVACTLNNRKWIGFETEPKYIEIANKRLEQIQLEDDMKVYE